MLDSKARHYTAPSLIVLADVHKDEVWKCGFVVLNCPSTLQKILENLKIPPYTSHKAVGGPYRVFLANNC